LPDDEVTDVEDDFTVDVDVELEAAEVDELADDEVAGIVLALTMPSSATPAIAVKAAPAVSRCSRAMAALRARIRPAVVSLSSIA
jgi:hypothetical protein